MSGPTSKASFLETIRTGRARWDALVAEVDRERMAEPGVVGEWSMKDVIAHIAWHEREMIGMLGARAFVGSDLWNLPLDERNQRIFEANRNRSLTDVLAEAEQVFQEFMEALETLTEKELTDPGRLPGMPAEWQPWQIIADNSYEHYQQHTPDIRAWLDKP